MNIKKIIAREFIILMIALFLCGAIMLGLYSYNKYIDLRTGEMSNAAVVIESKIADSKKFQNLFKLHQVMIDDEIFKEFTPTKFCEFKKVYSSPEQIKLLHEALRGDDLYKEAVPQVFSEAITKYDVINHFIHKGITSGFYLYKSESEENIDDLHQDVVRLYIEKHKLESEKMSTDEQLKLCFISSFIIFILLFVLRYIFYALKWSMNILRA